MRLISKNENETQKVATNFAKQLKGGEVILLYGDLGAGKTVFVKGLAKALGVREVVKSPTFNLMKCYEVKSETSLKFKIQNSKLILCHIDAYRLKNFNDLSDIGAEEYLGKENVVSVIEWAERTEEKLLMTNYELRIIRVRIQHGKKENERIIEIN